MTAPDPRLGEIEADIQARAVTVREWLNTNLDDRRNMYTLIRSVQAQAGDIAYLLAELRKAQEGLARVEAVAERLDREAENSRAGEARFAANLIRAAVAAATGP